MKYKLVAIDMDGTLLNSENKISDKNIETLRKAIKEGIYIVLCTGRMLKSAQYYSKDIELLNPIIACNGAIVSSKDGENIIYEKNIDIQTIGKLIQLADENDIFYYFYGIDTFYAKKTDRDNIGYFKSYADSLKKQQIGLKVLDKPIKILNTDRTNIYKFVFIEENKDKLLHFREKLKGIDNINISSSWFNNIEVMKEGVSKGSGLKYLCETLNIDSSQVVAIGDNENDISMFEVAGLAVGMGNGDEIIKKHSNVITDTNEQNGVANAIEKHVLKNNFK